MCLSSPKIALVSNNFFSKELYAMVCICFPRCASDFKKWKTIHVYYMATEQH